MKHTIKCILALALLFAVAAGMLSCAKIKEWTLGADTTPSVTADSKPIVDPTVEQMRRKLCYTFLVLTEGEGGIGTLHTLSYAVLDLNPDRMQLNIMQFPKQTYLNSDGAAFNSLGGLYEKTYTDAIRNGFDPQSSQSRAINELRSTFANDLMLPCDYYLYFTQDGIASLIDNLDGVELTVPFFMNFADGSYISTGTQKLTGRQAALMLYYPAYGEGCLQNAGKRIFSSIFMKAKTTIRQDVLMLFLLELNDCVKTDIPKSSGEDIYFVRKLLDLPADSISLTSVPTRLVPLLGGNVNVLSASDVIEKINGFMMLYSRDLSGANFDKRQRFTDPKDPYVSSVYASSGMSAPVFTVTQALTDALVITK